MVDELGNEENLILARELHPAMIAKLEAEATAITQRAAAAVAKDMAEAGKFSLETQLMEQNSRAGKMNLKQMERQEEAALAQDAYHQLYFFDQPVSASSVGLCKERLTYWSRTKPGCNIEIIFSSPGGSLFDGLVLYDFLKVLQRPGTNVEGEPRVAHKITTGVLGLAASMAGILLQAGFPRYMGKESYLMIHEMQFGAEGKQSDIEDAVAFGKMVGQRIINIFVEGQARALEAGTADTKKKMTKTQMTAAFKRKDWWLPSNEAFELGFIDEVR